MPSTSTTDFTTHQPFHPHRPKSSSGRVLWTCLLAMSMLVCVQLENTVFVPELFPASTIVNRGLEAVEQNPSVEEATKYARKASLRHDDSSSRDDWQDDDMMSRQDEDDLVIIEAIANAMNISSSEDYDKEEQDCLKRRNPIWEMDLYGHGRGESNAAASKRPLIALYSGWGIYNQLLEKNGFCQ